MIRFHGSDSSFKTFYAGVQMVRFKASVFIGAFHLSRREPDECRAELCCYSSHGFNEHFSSAKYNNFFYETAIPLFCMSFVLDRSFQEIIAYIIFLLC